MRAEGTGHERVWLYASNRADGLVDAATRESATFAEPEGDVREGWGVAFYQGDEVLHKKRPGFPGRGAALGAMLDVRTDCALVHVGQSRGGAYRPNEASPHRFRHFSAAFVGDDPEPERFPAEALPDFLRRAMSGNAIGERFFFRMLMHLQRAGQLGHDPDLASAAMLDALRAMADEAARGAGARYCLIVTTGRQTYALRQGAPLHHAHRKPSVVPSQSARQASVAHRYRSLLALPPNGARRDAPRDGYESLPDAHIARIDRDIGLSLAAL